MLAQAGDVENEFDNEGTGERCRGGGAEISEDREESVAEAMSPDDRGATEALGARGADIIVTEDVEHGDAREAGDVSEGHKGKRDGGEDHLPKRSPTTSGEPMQVIR